MVLYSGFSKKLNVVKAWNENFKKNIRHQQFGMFLKRRLNMFLKKLKRNSKILDLGCGNGEKANYIFRQNFQVVGVDSSKEAIDYAKKNFPEIKFYKRDVLSTKFKAKSFDAIVSIAVFHCFLEKERRRYVKEINRILKSRGLLFQLVLSSEDETKRSYKEIETKTFMQKSGINFHIFTKDEIKDYFSNFKFLNLDYHKKTLNKKQIAVYTMTLRKK